MYDILKSYYSGTSYCSKQPEFINMHLSNKNTTFTSLRDLKPQSLWSFYRCVIYPMI